jgi:Fe2+ or Zn2+ uptake regulation protein
MTLLYDHPSKELTLWCDGCGEAEVIQLGGVSEFVDFIEVAKENGWLIKKINDEYCHYCQSCR